MAVTLSRQRCHDFGTNICTGGSKRRSVKPCLCLTTLVSRHVSILTLSISSSLVMSCSCGRCGWARDSGEGSPPAAGAYCILKTMCSHGLNSLHSACCTHRDTAQGPCSPSPAPPVAQWTASCDIHTPRRAFSRAVWQLLCRHGFQADIPVAVAEAQLSPAPRLGIQAKQWEWFLLLPVFQGKRGSWISVCICSGSPDQHPCFSRRTDRAFVEHRRG